MTAFTPPSRAFLIPAYNPGDRLSRVVKELKELLLDFDQEVSIVIVDDGCTDGTFISPESIKTLSGTIVLRHAENRGKGSALQTGLQWARDHQVDELVTLDADGQHPAKEALRLLACEAAPDSLVLGVRDLVKAGAPLANQRSNAFSNLMLSWMGGRKLLDTQCGLRRYPTLPSLALMTSATGYAFESDLVLRAARQGLPMVQLPCEVLYPCESERLTYFDSVRDPTRIIFAVLKTTFFTPHFRRGRRYSKRLVSIGLLGLLLYKILSF